MKILVTGASGNLGSALLRALEGRDHTVHGIARRVPHGGTSQGPRWTALDLTDPGSLPSLRDLVEEADAVVNLAWALQPMRDAAYLRRASVGILEKVAGLALASEGTHLVHMSSVAVYSPRRSPDLVDESWAREGVPGATYSRLKVEAERLLWSATDDSGGHERVAVLRPCLVAQRLAGGPMLRCGAPALLPGGLLRRLPVAPVDERFGIQMVHADDVADAVVRVVEKRASGAFNLASEPVLSGLDVAEALGARPVPVRLELARAAVDLGWRLHLHPLDPGWVDMALQAPWVDTRRACDVLGWRPRHDAHTVLRELVAGMAAGSGSGTSALRPRRIRDGLEGSLVRGTVARRRMT